MNAQMISTIALVRKETTRVLRIWVQTLIPPGITMSLYFIIFGTLIGRRIGEMDGYPYMEYIAPGLIMMSVITNSYGNVVGSFFNAKIQRHIEELLVSPMSEASIVIGYLAGGIIRGLFVAAVVSFIALLFTPELNIKYPLLMLIVIIMTAGVFSLAGLLNAIFAKKFDDIAVIPSFVLAPLTYLGGVFYTVSLLPDFWQTISRFNPILYMVNSMRYSVLGVSDIEIIDGLAMIFVFFILLLFSSIYLLKKGIGIRD